MADFLGEPMLLRVLRATDGLFTKRVVVTRHPAVADLCRRLEVPVIEHTLPYRSDTIRLGLEAVSDMTGCLFCPGDQPLLRRETVAALAAAFVEAPELIWRPAFQGIPGTPVLFPGWTFPELLALPEGRGGSEVIKRHPHRTAVLSVADPHELMDADTPEALDKLKLQAKKEPEQYHVTAAPQERILL